jgi:hypothetical protein
VGTSKIAENGSPIPRDRVYLNESYFNGVPLLINGVNVNRVTPGFEKTFFEGTASVEVRTPFASTLSNNLYSFGNNDTNSTQFGDVTVYLKQLFYRSETLAASGGLGFELPTAGFYNDHLWGRSANASNQGPVGSLITVSGIGLYANGSAFLPALSAIGFRYERQPGERSKLHGESRSSRPPERHDLHVLQCRRWILVV